MLLFSGIVERTHLVLLLPALWWLAAQPRRAESLLALLGFAVVDLGLLFSIFTVDLRRYLEPYLPATNPMSFAAPFLALGALAIWAALLVAVARTSFPWGRAGRSAARERSRSSG